MEIGVGLPVAGRDASPDAIARVAEAADKLDYAAVWTFERVVRPIAELPSWDGKHRPLPDMIKLHELKKEKLRLKDELAGHFH